MKKIKTIFLLFLGLFIHDCYAQLDSGLIYKRRQKAMCIGIPAAYVATNVGLYSAWYRSYNSSKFHFFNDDAEWKQMDKVGHAYSGYVVGLLGLRLAQESGFSKKQQLAWSCLGLGFLSTVEVMDGFSSGWGFSGGDMLANLGGAGLLIGQQALWNEQRIRLKYYYVNSGLASYNINLLGANLPERMLKDYNAQTYWLSVNIASFLKKDNKFPKFLNIALGYGAHDMVRARNSNNVITDKSGTTYYFKAYRQYYLSLDVDFSKIKTKKKWLNKTLSIFNLIKIPFPSLELDSQNNWKINPL